MAQEHHEHHGTTETHPAGARPAAPGGQGHGGHDHRGMIAEFRRRLWLSLALTVPILLLSHGFWELFGLRTPVRFAGENLVLFALSSVVYFYGGWPFLRGLVEELRGRRPGMMTLIAVAISAAYLYSSAVVFGLPGMSFYWELATLIDIMLLGHWIEMRSIMGASRALEALVRLLPAEAHRLRADGTAEDVPVAALAPGDRVLIRPGERVPTDGEIVSGRSSLDESMLTGESKPVEREPGATVIGGSVNGEGALTIEVQKTGGDTYLAQVMDMVRAAQESRSHTQDVADRAALVLTLVALGGGALTLFVWLYLQPDFAFAMERAVTVMVIACPHALGLAVPLVVAVSTSLSARRGLLVRDRAAFERARDLDAVVFDKTGTLTQGRFGVSDIVTLGALAADECLRLAAALESQSEHPIARGIVEAARERNLSLPPVTDFRAVAGRGVEAQVDRRGIRIASPRHAREQGVDTGDPRVQQVEAQGKTVVYLIVDARAVAAIALADLVRPESRETIAALARMGVQAMMLTGDAGAVAKSVAAELGLADYFAEVLPEQKAAKIREIKARGLKVAMVGDGVNDAPALVEADLGIAVGAGTDVAIESADVVLVRSDPRDVVAILELSRATYRKMVQNLLWATGYNTVAIPLAAGVAAAWGLLLTPAAGAVLMSVSTVIVAINAQLLERRGDARPAPRASALPAHGAHGPG